MLPSTICTVSWPNIVKLHPRIKRAMTPRMPEKKQRKPRGRNLIKPRKPKRPAKPEGKVRMESYAQAQQRAAKALLASGELYTPEFMTYTPEAAKAYYAERGEPVPEAVKEKYGLK